MIVGYARVSTVGQTLDGQLAALNAAGAEKVFQEKVSGVQASNRKELGRLLESLNAGDVVIVTRLDRLARSTRDLLNLLAAFGEKGVQFRSLAEVWADTTTAHGRLILTVLGGLAEFERELIVSRTQEGFRRAIEQGKRIGRPSKLTPHQKREIRAALAEGSAIPIELARRYNVSPQTITRVAK